MSKVLIIAEHGAHGLNGGTAKCVTCATRMGASEVHILVLCGPDSTVPQQAAQISGVSKVLVQAQDYNEPALAAVQAPQIVSAAAGYSHVFGPSTTFGKDLMPRVAALLGISQISDIMEAVDAHTFKRPIYAGNAIATVRSPEGMQVVATVRNASFPAAALGGSAVIESISLKSTLPDHTRYVGLQSGGGDRPDLQTAAVVVSGGRALGSADAFKLVYDLADKLKAGVGASRAAVDAGYAPNDMQVGQTGKIIAPNLYFAVGISGAIQHLTGIKDAGTIVAINKDAEAPIFEIADIGLVADLFKAVPELIAALPSR